MHGRIKMKIRNGFVSNSSSSSFVCDICGETYTGYDACPDDFECTTCENEHFICNEHLRDVDVEVNEDGYTSKECCPICNFETYSESEMSAYLEKTRGISRDEVFAKVKEMNKRRRKLYEAEYISYVCDKFNLTDDILLSEIKEKFKVFEEYYSFLRSK